MSSSSSPHWQMARLRRETVEALRAFAKGHDAAYNKGQTPEGPGDNGYTVDQLVTILLDKALRHRERSKVAGERRKQKRLEAARQQRLEQDRRWFEQGWIDPQTHTPPDGGTQ